MKKLISLLLVFILLMGCFSVSVSADSNVVVINKTISRELHGAGATHHKKDAEEILSQYIDLSTFTALVMSGVSDCQQIIDISAYNIPESFIDTISDYFFYGVPEAFNINEFGWIPIEETGTIWALGFTYYSFADTADEYDACIAKMSNAADEILSGIKDNSTLNDEQKLLLAHDRLAAWNTYGYPENTTTIEAHTAYGALGNKMSVCQGYAMAYMYLLDRIGIDSYYCSSQNLVHGWNIVFLNGKKYHVDVTWDDTDRPGDIRHDNFLRSSNGIFATGHEAVDYDTTPTDTKYDDYFWQDSKTEFLSVDEEIYYIDHASEEIKRYSDNRSLISVSDIWMVGTNSYWPGNFSCLATDGKSLFYSLTDAIYRFDLMTQNTEKIYTPDLLENQSIFSFVYENETLFCNVGMSPYETTQVTKQYVHNYEQELLCGDANGDGRINTRDAAVIMQYINGWDVFIALDKADVYYDGKINSRDYVLLVRYVNDWQVTLGPKL